MPSMLGPSDQPVYRAAYYDGQTARRHEVMVHLRVDALDIVTTDGDVLDQWLYNEVSFADQGSGGIRVGKLNGEARLVFGDAAAFDALRVLAPDMHTQQKRARHGMLLAVASTVAVVVGLYFTIPYLSAAVVAMTPMSFEVKIGKSVSNDVIELLTDEDGKGVCHAAEGERALLKLVEDLSRYTSAPVPYQVNVLDIRSVNAMALPGGYIYVFRGLLDKAKSENELAGVLAHEMAHVDMRHPMHGLVRSYGMSWLTDMMFGGSSLGGLSNMLMMTSYSREAEEQADSAAILTLERSGAGAAGMTAFFERLRASETKSSFGLPGFLSTHPDSGAREQRARKGTQKGRAILNDEEWAALRAICR